VEEDSMKFKFDMVGMRNIKTAIAVFISIVISKLLKMEYPFYAAIAAIISMQSSVEASFKAGRNRMLGTFIGAVVGFICALISPGNALASAIGIVVVIYLCNILKWKESASIGGIVFLAIMLNLKGNSPLLYSINRILDTFLGIMVAILVNYFIVPPKDENSK
jgi:uncharacterized membrane protein YgaE (UPF0421/DUF939 family)